MWQWNELNRVGCKPRHWGRCNNSQRWSDGGLGV